MGLLEPSRLPEVWAGRPPQRRVARVAEEVRTLDQKPGRRATGARSTYPGRRWRACGPCRTRRPHTPRSRGSPWIPVSNRSAMAATARTYHTVKSLFRWSTMAGMRPLGLIFKYSGPLCSCWPKSRYTGSYVNPSSSRTMATFLGSNRFLDARNVREGGESKHTSRWAHWRGCTR